MTAPWQSRALQFPNADSPRTWLVTSAASPIAVSLIRGLLTHGDYVLACTCENDHEAENQSTHDLAALVEAYPVEDETDRKSASQASDESDRGMIRHLSVDCR